MTEADGEEARRRQVRRHPEGAAGKVYVDGIGKETEATFDEPVDIGVFAARRGGKEQDEKVLFLEKRKVADGDSTITVTVDGEPVRGRHRSVQQAGRPRLRRQSHTGDAAITQR